MKILLAMLLVTLFLGCKKEKEIIVYKDSEGIWRSDYFRRRIFLYLKDKYLFEHSNEDLLAPKLGLSKN